MNTIFLHINSVNLGLYFNTALISPANYIKTRSEDIQTKHNNQLLLSDRKWSKSSDCSLELAITSIEYSEIIKSDISTNYFLFNKPLPISRVKKIYFHSLEQSKIPVSSANTNAFVPEHLIDFVTKADIEEAVEFRRDDKHSTKKLDLTKQIEKFNQFLGGAAFMRIGGANFMNYSPKYFSTFAFFNKLIGNEYEKSTNKKIDTTFHGVFECKDKWERFCPFLYSQKAIFDEIKRVTSQKKLNISKENGIYNLDKINDDYIYILAILEDFGHKGKRRNTDGLVSLLSVNKIKKAEGITLLYGLYNGYSGFRNKYVLQDGNITKTVKFRLDSKIDYYTIESIYQYVFNQMNNNNFFQYIDTWLPKRKTNNYQGFETYQILDQLVIYAKEKPKFGEKEYLENLITTSSIIANTTNIITNEIKKWFRFPFNIQQKELDNVIENTLSPVIKNSLNTIYSQIIKDTENNESNSNIDQLEQDYILEQQKLETKIKELENENINLKDEIINTKNKPLTLNFPETKTVVQEYTEHKLNKLTIKNLKLIAEEKKLKFDKKYKKADFVNLILNSN